MNDFEFVKGHVLKFIRSMNIDDDLKIRMLVSFYRIYESPEALYELTPDIPKPKVKLLDIEERDPYEND